MEFLKSISGIMVLQNGNYIRDIASIQSLLEDENKVILQCAENLEEFQRGYTCDLEISFNKCNNTGELVEDNDRLEIIKDLVLVYINKDVACGSPVQFTYIFYK